MHLKEGLALYKRSMECRLTYLHDRVGKIYLTILSLLLFLRGPGCFFKKRDRKCWSIDRYHEFAGIGLRKKRRMIMESGDKGTTLRELKGVMRAGEGPPFLNG